MSFFTAIFLLVFAGLSGVSSLSAASAAKPIWKAQNNSPPAASGPGIVICEPVAATASSSVADFGSGCAVWLQVVVGGQPQFGKTPLWGDLDRARTELKRPDLRISSAEALDLAPILGVTHAAVGTLRGAEPHLTLTYRLLQVPSGVPVGAATTLTGTQAQIAAGLPQIAHTLVKDLGRATASLPSSTDLTANDLQILGQERWRRTVCSRAERAALEVMAAHSPVAGLINLNRHGGGYTAHYHTATETLLTQAGDNPLVWGVITQRNNLMLVAHAAQLSVLAARYPHNCILGMVQAFRYQLVQDHALELQAAEKAIKDAPHSPDAWDTYGTIISSVAGDERQGRVYDALSSSEAAHLGHLYAASEAAAHQAVQLDPGDAEAWENLAEDATFNSNAALADHAIQKALALNKDKQDVYYWALQMYQPKWDDNPAKLDKFARMAAADTTLHVDDVLKLSDELASCGYPALQAKMLNNFTARRQTLLALRPDDGQAHFELAIVLNAMGKSREALVEYQKAAALFPGNATVHYRYGAALYSSQEINQAGVQLREALEIDPDFPEAHYILSEVLQNQSSKDDQGEKDAQGELQLTLALDPTYAEAYSNLAAIYQSQNKLTEAISCYQSAIRYGDIGQPNDYLNMLQVMDMAGQDEKVLATGTEALKLYGDSSLGDDPDDANIYDLMAKAYLHEQKWDMAIAMCQAHLRHKADDPEAHEILAEADLGEGHLADAQSEWRTVTKYSGDNLFTTSQQKERAEDFLKKYP